MSITKEPSESLAAPESDVDADSQGQGFETWLRRAAHAPEVQVVPLPRLGRVIGEKYRIEEQLGRGGMGAVYRATHVISNKQVALKWRLRPASDERAQQRFTREARAAGRIDHPNVVDVYDIGQDGEGAYLVMELLRGESLHRRLARGPLAPTEVVDLLLPAMRGVAAAHREGVVHRDLKPDNIFLCQSPDGGEREAKVLDFGISSISAPDYESKASLTEEGAVLGTPTYMSPEQLESSKDMDVRADVYAFGVILYEALTGRVPFTANSYSALVLAIVNTAPRPLRELRPEVPAALEQVVMKAMEKHRGMRIETMDALIAALSPFASAGSATTGPEGAAGTPVRRGPAGVIASAGIAAAVVFGWWLLGNGATVPDARPAMPRAPATLPAATTSAGAAVPARSDLASSAANAPASAPPPPEGTPSAPPGEQAPPAAPAVASPRSASRRRPARVEEPRTSAPFVSAPAPSAPGRARSGSITVGDL